MFKLVFKERSERRVTEWIVCGWKELGLNHQNERNQF